MRDITCGIEPSAQVAPCDWTRARRAAARPGLPSVRNSRDSAGPERPPVRGAWRRSPPPEGPTRGESPRRWGTAGSLPPRPRAGPKMGGAPQGGGVVHPRSSLPGGVRARVVGRRGPVPGGAGAAVAMSQVVEPRHPVQRRRLFSRIGHMPVNQYRARMPAPTGYQARLKRWGPGSSGQKGDLAVSP